MKGPREKKSFFCMGLVLFAVALVCFLNQGKSAFALVYSSQNATGHVAFWGWNGTALRPFTWSDLGFNATGNDMDAISLGDDTPIFGSPRHDVFAVVTSNATKSGAEHNATDGNEDIGKRVYLEHRIDPSSSNNTILLNDIYTLTGNTAEGQVDALDLGIIPDCGNSSEKVWIYFSLTEKSSLITSGGYNASDVLMCNVCDNCSSTLKVFADADHIGLNGTHDIDGLSIYDADRDGNSYNSTTDYIIYTLHSPGRGADVYHYGYNAPSGNNPHFHNFGLNNTWDGISAMEHLAVFPNINVPVVRPIGIGVDGNGSDWDSIGPVFSDNIGDSQCAGENGTDLTDIFMTTDGQYLYVRLDTQDGKYVDSANATLQLFIGERMDSSDTSGERRGVIVTYRTDHFSIEKAGFTWNATSNQWEKSSNTSQQWGEWDNIDKSEFGALNSTFELKIPLSLISDGNYTQVAAYVWSQKECDLAVQEADFSASSGNATLNGMIDLSGSGTGDNCSTIRLIAIDLDDPGMAAVEISVNSTTCNFSFVLPVGHRFEFYWRGKDGMERETNATGTGAVNATSGGLTLSLKAEPDKRLFSDPNAVVKLVVKVLDGKGNAPKGVPVFAGSEDLKGTGNHTKCCIEAEKGLCEPPKPPECTPDTCYGTMEFTDENGIATLYVRPGKNYRVGVGGIYMAEANGTMTDSGYPLMFYDGPDNDTVCGSGGSLYAGDTAPDYYSGPVTCNGPSSGNLTTRWDRYLGCPTNGFADLITIAQNSTEIDLGTVQFPMTYTISGRVVNATSSSCHGISGIEVMAWSAANATGARTLTDSNGNYTLTLPEGVGYVVEAGGIQFDPNTMMPLPDSTPFPMVAYGGKNATSCQGASEGTDWNNAEKFSLNATNPAHTGINFALSTGRHIKGMVVDCDALGEKKCRVQAWSDAGGSWGGADVKAGCDYLIKGLKPASGYRVQLLCEDRPPVFYDGNENGMSGTDNGTTGDWAWGSATGLNLTSESKENINFKILKSEASATFNATISISGFNYYDDEGKRREVNASNPVMVFVNLEPMDANGTWQGREARFEQGDGTKTLSIEGIVPGKYKVSVWPDWHTRVGGGFFERNSDDNITGDWMNADVIELKAGNTTFIGVSFNTGVSINGTIAIGGGTNGTTYTIWVDAWSESKKKGAWTSVDITADDTGGGSKEYVLVGVPRATDLKVRAEGHGFSGRFYKKADVKGTPDFMKATPVNTTSGSQSGIDITLGGGTKVTGRVILPAGKTCGSEGLGLLVGPDGVCRIGVDLFSKDAHTGAWAEAQIKKGKDEGNFSMTLDAGTYELHVWAGELTINATASATNVTVKGDQMAIRITLKQGDSIKGTVCIASETADDDNCSSSEKAIHGIWVGAIDNATMTFAGGAMTDSHGNFIITGVDSSRTYILMAHSPDYPEGRRVVSGADFSDADIDIEEGKGLSGRVYDQSENGIYGMDVFAFSDNGTPEDPADDVQAWTRTDYSGNFTLKGLKASKTYHVTVHDPGGYYQDKHHVIVLNAKGDVNVTASKYPTDDSPTHFKLGAGHVIMGKVECRDSGCGFDPSNATFEWMVEVFDDCATRGDPGKVDGNDDFILAVPIDRSGSFVTPLVANGDYVLRSRIPGWRDGANTTATIEDADNTTITIKVRQEDTSASIYVTVNATRITGNIHEVQVMVINRTSGEYRGKNATMGTGGIYTANVTGLPADSYDIYGWAYAANGTLLNSGGNETDFQITGANSTTITLRP